MSFSLPNPDVPTNGQALDATPLLENIVALAEAIQSFDGSQIDAGTILAAAFDASINPNTILNEIIVPFVKSGTCVWAATSGLAAGMTSGIIYYNGIRVTVVAIATRTFTPSKDTYVDIDSNGNPTYPETTNAGAAPPLTANSIRIAKVVTNGSAVTSVAQTGIDSLNNPIYPKNPYGYNSWLSWTPAWTGVTIGNATVVGRYTQIGKTITATISMIFGSTTSFTGNVQFSLPVTAAARYNGADVGLAGLGVAYIEDAGVAAYQGFIEAVATTRAQINSAAVNGTYLNANAVTSTIPFTWATGDFFSATLTYEAA